MKKVLLSAAVIAALGMTACNSKKDCNCTSGLEGAVIEFKAKEVEGDCKDVTWGNVKTLAQVVNGTEKTLTAAEITKYSDMKIALLCKDK